MQDTERFSLADYDYSFPPELIAQRTAGKGKTRILHVPKAGGDFTIMPAATIVDLFREGDCLVVNNTKVIPARLLGKRASGGQVEVMLLTALPSNEKESRWEAFVRPGRAFRLGDRVQLGEEAKAIEAIVESVEEGGSRILRFPQGASEFEAFLQEQGRIPLPPYIDREDDMEDRQSYQTVFAKYSGAVAAPTASLHFSEEILNELKSRGVQIAEVTLHVGAGTFQNIQVDDFREHKMHGERYQIDAIAVQKITEAKARGGRVITVGTTSTRVLETVADELGNIKPHEGMTHAFIYPSVRFKIVDGILTNFHWPKSSLVLLVAAFLGRERTLDAYRYAVDQKMMLFSYGDGMLIL